jgi:hypothetical protein
MDLAECVARSMAVQEACNAPDRDQILPPGRTGETWREHLSEALRLLDEYGRTAPSLTPAMAMEVQRAQEQLRTGVVGA